MKVEIKRINGDVILSGNYKSIKEAIVSKINGFFGSSIWGADLHGVDLSELDLSNIDLSLVNFAYANLAGANLSYVNFFRTNFFCTNLMGTNLRHSNLFGANLYRAKVDYADFTGADVSNTHFYDNDLSTTIGLHLPIISITGSRHSFKFSENIKIGCYDFPIDYWLEYYEEIGEKNGYTKKQVQEYLQYIKFAQKLSERKK